MARSLSRIIDQISRLQKEAATIQNEVVDRIRKEISKYGLTAEQLFGSKPARRGKTPKTSSAAARPVKFADDAGNTWHGMGKRPDWLRQALEAGKALEDFLVGKSKPVAKKASRKKTGAKTVAKAVTVKKAPAKKVTRAPKKRVAAKKAKASAPKKSTARKSPAKSEKAAQAEAAVGT